MTPRVTPRVTEAWRLCHRRFADDPFSGRGTRAHGSRWCPAGVALSFASSTLSLAILEVLVHLTTPRALAGFVAFRLGIPETLVEDLSPDALPTEWRSWPWSARTQQIGSQWMQRGDTVALRVPSAVVPRERNLLVNAAHPGFARVEVEGPLGLDVDGRLVEGTHIDTLE